MNSLSITSSFVLIVLLFVTVCCTPVRSDNTLVDVQRSWSVENGVPLHFLHTFWVADNKSMTYTHNLEFDIRVKFLQDTDQNKNSKVVKSPPTLLLINGLGNLVDQQTVSKVLHSQFAWLKFKTGGLHRQFYYLFSTSEFESVDINNVRVLTPETIADRLFDFIKILAIAAFVTAFIVFH